jgi:hypothetical protein
VRFHEKIIPFFIHRKDDSMGTMNDALGNAGAPILIPLGEGQVLQIARLTPKRIAFLEAWVEGQVVAGIQRQKAQLPREDYLGMLNAANRDITVDKLYSWGKPDCMKMLDGTFEGQAMFFHTLLVPHNPEITLEDVKKLLKEHADELKAGLNRVVTKLQTKPGREAGEDENPTLASTPA